MSVRTAWKVAALALSLIGWGGGPLLAQPTSETPSLAPAVIEQADPAAPPQAPSAIQSLAYPVQPAAPPTIVVNPAPVQGGLPVWVGALLLLVGAALAGLGGVGSVIVLRRAEDRQKKRMVGLVLATELETRLLAYESVPLPPSVDAGVSFVSSVTSLSAVDNGFRTVQGLMYLLPEKLAAHVSVHYAAVQRVSDFVKGQSLAAAARMLQANRLGGHPCPDAGAMRDAHVELGAAFRGLDKLIIALRGIV